MITRADRRSGKQVSMPWAVITPPFGMKVLIIPNVCA
jgi:hypothetical protein